jgi:hypothetical protein
MRKKVNPSEGKRLGELKRKGRGALKGKQEGGELK